MDRSRPLDDAVEPRLTHRRVKPAMLSLPMPATAMLGRSLWWTAAAALTGLGFALVSATDLRWAIALIAALVFIGVLLILPAPRRLLWVLLIGSFQLQDPSVRLL